MPPPSSSREVSRPARAVQVQRFGGCEVMTLQERAAPEPGPGQLLIAPTAVALNPKDVLVRKGRFAWGVRAFPYVPGFDFCGRVERCGPGTGAYRAGQQVYGMLAGMTGGALADRFVVPASRVSLTPPGFDPVALAGVPLAALTALQALRGVARLRPGQSVCINGASGGVGTLALQIARRLGALVTSLSSARNLDLCRELGAHCALDYADGDALREREFDCFFDVFGNRSLRQVRGWLAANGCYVTTVPSRRNLRDHLRTCASLGRRARLVVVRHRPADLDWITQQLARGTLRPVVDRIYPLEDFRSAFAYLETRRARGKVVIRMPDPVAGAGTEPGCAGPAGGRGPGPAAQVGGTVEP